MNNNQKSPLKTLLAVRGMGAALTAFVGLIIIYIAFEMCIRDRLFTYSLGLGIPFILSAVLIDYLKSAFDWIKKNYKIINTVSGVLLVLIGILMMTGTMGRLLSLLS